MKKKKKSPLWKSRKDEKEQKKKKNECTNSKACQGKIRAAERLEAVKIG